MHSLRRVFPRLAAASVALLFGGLGLLALPGAAEASMSWSGPVAIDPQAGGVPINRVACASLTQCTAVDGVGHAVTFNPESPHGVTTATIGTHSLSGIACPSSAQCTAVDVSGNETTFDPESRAGGSPLVIDSKGIPLGVACPSTSQCTTVDANGEEITFDPQSGKTLGSTEIDPNGVLISVQCPGGSPTWCVAVDISGAAIGFHPTGAPGVQGPTQIDSGQNTVVAAAACSSTASSTQCALVDNVAGAIGFKAPLGGSPQPGGSGTILQSNAGETVPTALACPSDTECVAVDGHGNESLFDQTLIFGVAIPVDPGQALSDVACPSESQCTAVDRDGQEVTFNPNPQSVGTPTPAAIDGHSNLSSLACPSVTQCTAVDVGGTEVTFTPGSSSMPQTGKVDPAATGVYGVACPSTRQCTAVDNVGDEVTFNPTSPGKPSPTAIAGGHTLYAIACPSITQCTAVDDGGAEVTFNPQAADHPSVVVVDSGHSLLGLACPSAKQCSAVDDSGAEVTFNPKAPGSPVPHLIDRTADAAITCVASIQCTAVDGSGDEVTFNPQAPSEASALAIDPHHRFAAVACRSVGDCVAVDTSGRVVEGDPHLTVAWSTQQVSAHSLAAVQCPTLRECAVVDGPGNAFAGSDGPLPPVPRVASRPSAVGQALQGRTLSARRGRWLNPTAFFTYQWERCNAGGASCAPIASAVSAVYRLTAADVGHRIRLAVVAGNSSGASARSISPRTGIVQLSLVVTHASMSGLARGAPRLMLSLRAGSDGRRISRMTILLPAGFTLRRAHRIAVRNGGTVLGYANSAIGSAITIVLPAPASEATVAIGPGELVAAARLIGQSRSPQPPKLRVSLTVTQQDRAVWRLSLPLT
jgi:hypothetical protein